MGGGYGPLGGGCGQGVGVWPRGGLAQGWGSGTGGGGSGMGGEVAKCGQKHT